MPASEAIALRAHRAPREVTMHDLSKRGGFPRPAWRIEQRHKAATFQMRRHRQICQIAEGWEDIDQLDEPAAFRADSFSARRADDQRHTRGQFEVGELAPEVLLAEVITVVTPQDDDR